MTSHTKASRTLKPSSLSEELDIMILRGYCGAKDLGTSSHFISGPWPMPRRKKCWRKNKENLDCQDILPRITLSSADQGHRRRKWHTLEDSPPKRPKQKDQHSGLAMGAWWRSNSRRGCHLRIKCPQLTVWPH